MAVGRHINRKVAVDDEGSTDGSEIDNYCTISTVSSVTRNGQKKRPCFKVQERKRKFIGHLGQKIFRIRELTVEMVQYEPNVVEHPATTSEDEAGDTEPE